MRPQGRNNKSEVINMTNKLQDFLRQTIKKELYWMHHDMDDEAFGIPTDLHSWCTRALTGEVHIDSVLAYFEEHYGQDYKVWIQHLRDAMD